jgi:hypothetical protein
MLWRCMGWRYSSTILNLGTRWRWVLSFTPRPLYPWVKSPRYPFNMRLGEPQSQSGCSGVEKNLLPLPGIKPRPSSLLPVATVAIQPAIVRTVCHDEHNYKRQLLKDKLRYVHSSLNILGNTRSRMRLAGHVHASMGAIRNSGQKTWSEEIRETYA